MPTASEAIDAAIQEALTARAIVSKLKGKQVGGVDALASLKATALAWFNTHRPVVSAGASNLDLVAADMHYTTILNSTAKFAARQTYLDALRDAKAALVTMRTAVLTAPATPTVGNTDDLAPDFSPLAGN